MEFSNKNKVSESWEQIAKDENLNLALWDFYLNQSKAQAFKYLEVVNPIAAKRIAEEINERTILLNLQKAKEREEIARTNNRFFGFGAVGTGLILLFIWFIKHYE